MDKTHPIIISLGGSLVVPPSGIDTGYILEFNKFIRNKISQGFKFFIVVGGGSTARKYIDAARKIKGEISDWDLDWLGIHATQLNAHLIRTIFQDIAHPRIILNYDKRVENFKESLVIAGGWNPGCSTDYDAVYLANLYKAKILINMSNIDKVYDRDPKKFKDAKPIDEISWEEFEKIVGNKWTPGKNTPFDPPGTQLAKHIGLTVYIVGKDFVNLDNILNGKKFKGTIISSM